jgi:hypothetical protein
MFVFDRFKEIIAAGMGDKTDTMEDAERQPVKNTTKLLKKFVVDKKIGGEKIAKK